LTRFTKCIFDNFNKRSFLLIESTIQYLDVGHWLCGTHLWHLISHCVVHEYYSLVTMVHVTKAEIICITTETWTTT